MEHPWPMLYVSESLRQLRDRSAIHVSFVGFPQERRLVGMIPIRFLRTRDYILCRHHVLHRQYPYPPGVDSG